MKVMISKGSKDTSISVPSSKSLSHRALIAASLSASKTRLYNIVDNKDTQATMGCLKALGVSFEKAADALVVHGKFPLSYPKDKLDCFESGSTLRFLIPLAATLSKEVRFIGQGRLLQRPQNVYEDIFCEKGMMFLHHADEILVKGPLQSGKYTLDGNVSSQFVTGMLMSLPLAQSDSILTVKEPFASRSYVDLTLDILNKAHITIESKGNTFLIPGGQTYALETYTVPGDDSQMAFFAAKGLLATKPLNVINIEHDSKQGDHVIIDYLQKMGAKTEKIENGYRFYPSRLHAAQLDLEDCPDLGPILFALAATIPSTTHFLHTKRLKMKESDRITAMKEELEKIGAIVKEEDDEVWVTGVSQIKDGVQFDGHNDHRIVMALSILASLTNKTTIQGAQAISKSYPTFFEDLEKSGCHVVIER